MGYSIYIGTFPFHKIAKSSISGAGGSGTGKKSSSKEGVKETWVGHGKGKKDVRDWKRASNGNYGRLEAQKYSHGLGVWS